MFSYLLCAASAYAAAVIGEPFYIYDQQTAQWPDEFCNAGDFQQAPIEVNMDKLAGELSGSASIYSSPSFKYKKDMHVHIDDKFHINMDYELDDPTAHFIKVTRDATDTEEETTTTYYLYNVHFHLGRAEHVISEGGSNQGTDANVHAVHMSEDGQLAVIEIPYKFSDSATTDFGFNLPATCSDGNSAIEAETFCGMRDTDGKVAKATDEDIDMEAEWTQNSDTTTLLAMLGLKEGASISDFVSYNGSLTTPGCNGDVTWFVYTKGPIETKPWANWESIRDLFPNEDTSGVAGNYRLLQERTQDTMGGYYRAAVPEGVTRSLVTAGVAAALSFLF